MKDTIKNSITGAFAIFGLVALISSSNNAPTLIHEGSNIPESHVYSLIESDGRAFSINAKTGEVKMYVRTTTSSGATTLGLKEYKPVLKEFGEK